MQLSLLAAATAAIVVLAIVPALADTSVPLSSLDLSKATQGFGKPGVNKSVDGHALTLGGRTFASGLGTHSPGTLALRLNGGATRFTATVGIDDEVPGGKGSAEFEVLGDRSKILYRSGVLCGGEVPKEVSVDLTGVRQMVLRVTTGGDGFEFDHADWADAKFTVTGPRPETAPLSVTVPTISMPPAPAAPRINDPAVVAVRAGTPLLWTAPVSGVRPLKFSTSSLPPGLTLNPATGTLTGTLVKPGSYPVEIRVSNALGRDRRTVRLLVGETLAQTPSMGWNSYDCFGDDVTEAEVLANADYVRTRMQPYGWDTVVVDYRWYDPGAANAPNNTGARAGVALTMDANGRLLPSPNRFPSASDGQGFRALANQVHAMGLKFGIHIMRGIPRNAVKANLPIDGSTLRAADAANTSDTCPWCPDMYGVRGDTPAGKAYYDSLLRLYARWGVDYIKMDDTSAPYHADEIDAVHAAIGKCGRSVVYSLSPGETPIDQGAHVAGHANLWRVSGDFWDGWAALSHEFILGERWHDRAAPGHWPDADMLPVGHLSVRDRSVGKDRATNFTKAEQMTLVSLWSMLPSPLMVGANLPDNDPWTLALLTNPEVLALDQDALGAAATRHAGPDETEVWTKPLADGSCAVALFNTGDLDAPVTARWTDLGISGRRAVRDLWLRRDLAPSGGSCTATVPAHGVVLLRLTANK